MKKKATPPGLPDDSADPIRPLTERQIRKQMLEQANLFDDLYANLFFDSQVPIAQLMVDKICGPGYVVQSVRIQHTLPSYLAKGSRLDVLALDEHGHRHVFEFQLRLHPDIPKRSRWYRSKNDMQMLEPGQDYSELQDLTVVFICMGDAIGAGKPMHVFTMKDEEGRQLNDGQKAIFIDASYKGDWALKDLMHDVLCTKPEEMIYDEFRERTKLLKRKEDGTRMYSTVFNEYVEERERLAAEEAAAKAARAREEAERKTKYEQIEEMFGMDISLENISRIVKIALPEIERMHQEYEATGTFRL